MSAPQRSRTERQPREVAMSPQRTVAILLVVTGACAPALGGSACAAPGDAEAGRALFAAKQCGRCHRPPGEPGIGPALDVLRRPQGEMELAGRLWNHVPAMAASLAPDGFDGPRSRHAQTVAALGRVLGGA